MESMNRHSTVCDDVDAPCVNTVSWKLVHEWSTMTRITDMHGDLQPESSGWLFVATCRGGGIL